MPDEFVPLAALVRERSEGRRLASEPPAPAPPGAGGAESATVRAAPVSETVARELGAVRLAALEAFDRLRARLLAALASEVLARELALAPADMQALSERILRDLAEEEPVGLVLCASDAIGIRTTLPVRVDSALRPGDLIVEVRDGEIDARFDLRLVAVLEPLAQADALDR